MFYSPSYLSYYASPLGRITIVADDEGLSGLWFEGQKYYGQGGQLPPEERENAFILQAKQWLDQYFEGQKPQQNVTLHLRGTSFQQTVWRQLMAIPYGQTVTYRHIAAAIAHAEGAEHMSAQAVGNAVGHNPLSIIIPCHRVVGTDGSLRGYAGGLERKQWLLRHEGALLI